ncbi:PKD domain-containing protein, partial [Bacteroidota bacterium]
MKKNCIFIKFIIALISVNILTINRIFPQIDTLFWFVAPHITKEHQDPGAGPVSFNIATFNSDATVTIDVPANKINFTPITMNIVANSAQKITLWDNDYAAISPIDPTKTNAQVRNMLEEGKWPAVPGMTLPSNRGIRIRSTDSITVYYEIERPNNTDLFSLKGRNALGSEFYVPVQNYRNNQSYGTVDSMELALSTVNIVAIEEATVIEVYPPPSVKIEGHESVSYPDYFEITLDMGETYALLPLNYSINLADRLAGLYVKVKNGKRVSVIVTDDSVFGISTSGWDIVGDQLIPLQSVQNNDTVDLVGEDYIIVKGPQAANDLVYIVGTQNGSSVSIKRDDGSEISSFALTRQQQQTIQISQTVLIDADKPVVVLHETGVRDNGQEEGGALIPTISMCTGSRKVGFIRGNQSGGKELYLSVLVRNGGENNFYLSYFYDNAGTPTLRTINLPDNFIQFTGTKWSYAIFDESDWGDEILSNMPCFLWNNKTIFHLGINHGGDAGGNYGYFSNFNQIIPAAHIEEAGSDAAYFCIGTPVELFASGGDSCKWWPADYLDDPTSLTPISTPPHEMTYTATIYGYCDDSATSTVTIIPEPLTDARFSIDQPTGCSPLDVSFYEYSLNADHIYWDFESDNTIDTSYHNYDPVNGYTNVYFDKQFTNSSDNTIVYKAKVKVNRSICQDSLIKDITVYPEITPNIQKSVSSGCSPLRVDFANITTTGIDTVYYQWDLGDGMSSSDSVFYHIYSNLSSKDTSYIITLKAISKHGCEFYAYDTITVSPQINSAFLINKFNICSPDSILLNNQSTGYNLKYFWDFDDGDILNTTFKNSFFKVYDSIDVPYTQTDFEIYQVQLAIQDTISGCGDTSTQTITVNPGLIAMFTPDFDSSNISPFDLSFTNTSITNLGTTNFEWDFGDGITSNQVSPTHQFLNNNPNGTIYTVSMNATTQFNCKDTAQQINITVYSPISAKINVNKTSGCSPFKSSIVNASQGANHIYYWTFGDGTDTISQKKDTIKKIYTLVSGATESQQYKIKLLATDTISKATSEDSVIITVYPSATANFASIFDPNGCQPFNVYYTNTSSASATEYKWEFSDGSSTDNESPSHNFYNTSESVQLFSTRLIALTDYNCTDTTDYEYYSVSPEVIADISIDTTFGCSPFKVIIKNNSQNADIFSWDYGNGNKDSSNQQSINQLYINSGLLNDIDTIKLKAEYSFTGCSDSTTKNLIIYPKPDVGFNSLIDRGCQPLNVQFLNTSNSIASQFYWDFDDYNTSTSISPTHTFYNNGSDSIIHNVELIGISDNKCEDTAYSKIYVMPYINASFYVDTANSCSPLRFKVYNISEGANRFEWYFDGILDTVTTDLIPFSYEIHNNTDTLKEISIKLIAINSNYGGCTSEDSIVVKVYPRISADFIVTDSIGCHPLVINFLSSNSIGANGVVPFKWNFGDGNNSILANPTHTFYNTGINDSIYIIKLLATSKYQCTDEITKIITVHPLIEAHFEADKTFGCPDLDVQFTNTSTSSATDFYWDFGDREFSTLNNPSHTLINNSPISSKNYTIILTATDNNHGGCSNTYSQGITVYPKPVADFTPIDTIDCHPFNVQFVNFSQGNQLKYYWKFDTDNSSVKSDPSFTFLNTNTTDQKDYNVSLRIVSEENCESADSTTISVYPYLNTDFTLDEYAGCPPFDIVINNNTLGATNYNWDFGDNTGSSLEVPLKQYPELSTNQITEYIISLTASNIGCRQTVNKKVKVYPYVIAEFEPRSGCHPFKVDFNNLSQGYNLKFNWDFDDGGTSNVSVPSHIFYNQGSQDSIRNVKLTATSEHGCSDFFSANNTIYANPEARFELENSADCSPFTVSISNTSNTSQYLWDFGDGQT